LNLGAGVVSGVLPTVPALFNLSQTAFATQQAYLLEIPRGLVSQYGINNLQHAQYMAKGWEKPLLTTAIMNPAENGSQSSTSIKSARKSNFLRF
jgi:hypothetical protein